MGNNDEIKDLLVKLLRKFERLERRVDKSIAVPEKKTWVKVKTITGLTGWNRDGLKAARKNKVVICKRENGEIFYLLESLPERLIINKVTV